MKKRIFGIFAAFSMIFMVSSVSAESEMCSTSDCAPPADSRCVLVGNCYWICP